METTKELVEGIKELNRVFFQSGDDGVLRRLEAATLALQEREATFAEFKRRYPGEARTWDFKRMIEEDFDEIEQRIADARREGEL